MSWIFSVIGLNIIKAGIRFDIDKNENEVIALEKKKRKKIFIIIGAVAAVALVIAAYFLVPYVKRHYRTVTVDVAGATAAEKVDFGEKRILTVYFTRVGNSDFEENVDAVSSASLMEENGTLIGNSQLLAAMVWNSVGGDIYAISTEKKYPSSYNDTVSVARDEQAACRISKKSVRQISAIKNWKYLMMM